MTRFDAISPSTGLSAPMRRAAVLVIGLAMSACASITPPPPEEIVRDRAQQRWDALLKGDMPAAHAMLSPAARTLMPLERFRGNFGAAASWKSATVTAADCSAGDRCKVTVRLQFQPIMLRQRLGAIDSSFEETWVREDGQWWFVQPQ